MSAPFRLWMRLTSNRIRAVANTVLRMDCFCGEIFMLYLTAAT